MKFKKVKLIIGSVALVVNSYASASLLTATSTSGIDVTSVGASEVGGIVLDLEGLNGTHVIGQISASSLFEGFSYTNPFTIGSQGGYTSSVTDSFGGGLVSAAFRFSLYDGDTASGDFDYNENTLLVNGLDFGNWSDVTTENTDSMGITTSQGSSLGFRNNLLDTGWFSSSDESLLSTFYSSILSAESIVFELDDVDPGDNYFDFTQGIDASLINVGTAPTTVISEVPEPTTLITLALSLFGFGLTRRKNKI